jgi:hypothetical protein
VNRHDQTILLGALLERQGPRVQRTALLAGRRALLSALHQCRTCGAHAQCEAWLRTGAQDGFGSFCPNAGYVRSMKALTA